MIATSATFKDSEPMAEERGDPSGVTVSSERF